MDLMTWLSLAESKMYIAALILSCILACNIVLMTFKRKDKDTHISGFYDRKAKKGEIEKE